MGYNHSPYLIGILFSPKPLTQTKPTRTQINQQLKIAALLAVDDYINDPELTALTALDGEDIY